MKDLLFLVHRIPYPPNKGDKIVSYNMLKFLSRHYRVHVGTFIDDPQDLQHIKTLEAMIQGELHLVSVNPALAKAKSLLGLLTGSPLSVRFYHDSGFQLWVDRTIERHGIRKIVIVSGAMAQFVAHHREAGMRRIVDFVDVDSDKWRQYAERQGWPMNWIYRRESRTLLAFEQRVAREMDFTAFISPHEAMLFQTLTPDIAHRITSIEIGVDLKYYDPVKDYPNPFPNDVEALVFTGAMDYWANVEKKIFHES